MPTGNDAGDELFITQGKHVHKQTACFREASPHQCACRRATASESAGKRCWVGNPRGTITQYFYGTTLANSELATSTLKRQEIDPDSVDNDDVIQFTDNRQQQVTTSTRNKGAMLKKGAVPAEGETLTPEQELNDPLVLEFLGLKDEYSESDLEEAPIRQPETFLLELGGDFTFVGRQKRLRIGDEWYRVSASSIERRNRVVHGSESRSDPKRITLLSVISHSAILLRVTTDGEGAHQRGIAGGCRRRDRGGAVGSG